jgi:hypothetical protein
MAKGRFHYRLKLVFSILFVCIIAQFHWATDVCSAVIQIKATPRVAAEPSGKVNVGYDIRNEGSDPAYNVTITTFLGMDARKSEPYNEIKGGVAWSSYQCDFDMSAMIPGEYIIVSRISFNDQGGQQYSVYQFNPLPHRVVAQASNMKPALALNITQPVLNAKSPIDASGKFSVSLTNNNKGQIRTALTFYLPTGISVDVPERFYDIGPGGTKTDDIDVKLTASPAPNKYAYDAVAWYEYYGVHYAQHVKGVVRVEEKPVLLIGFVVLSILVLACVGGFVWWRRRKAL